MTILQTVTAAAEDIRSTDAGALLDELTDALIALYPGSDGLAGFKLSDGEVPRAAFVIARVEGYAVGCGALRPLDDTTGEVKRMFTRAGYRRQGIAQAVLTELERLAVDFGYTTIKLQTGPRQLDAAALYELVGYYRIPHYMGNWDKVLAYQKDLVPVLEDV